MYIPTSVLLGTIFLAQCVGGFVPPSLTRTRNQLFLCGSLGALQEVVEELDPKAEAKVAAAADDDDFCLVDFENFWRKTQANFTTYENGAPDRAPDFKSKGSKGSKYWDMGDYVIRYSNHWSGQHGIGRIVDCEWTIDSEHQKKEYSTGICKYIDFRKGRMTANEKKKMRGKKK